ncbi:MAG: plasmid pRiA4b ORF-3 family protein [Deltaproteobacteria bacterium]|nr:plasmid pRiA4b ORF-3 family protein [Deltaproteobacteria bacterium]
MTKKQAKKRTAQPKVGGQKLYTFDVFIVNGPMTRRFVKRNKVVSRTIQIRGDQSLEDLHNAIFDAFDREDNHMYEFQIGGKGPMDPKARRYVLNMYDDDLNSEAKPAGDVRQTPIGSIGLKENEAFGYWFDFGDDWWHQVNVVSIEEVGVVGKYPKVTKRVGKSPPQYVDWNEEGE